VNSHQKNEVIPLVEMRNIVKRFPGVLANDRTQLQLVRGEVHALLGENGAGKSTLMCILSGLYKPDAGEIFIEGHEVKFSSARDAMRAGIGMVHQQFCLVDTFSVAENVTLGMPYPRLRIDIRLIEKQVEELGEKFNIRVDPRAKIWQLSVGEQQRVEILKLLYRQAQVLILDEPTSVLTPQESAELTETLRRMASTGRGILYISHKLNEVLEIADRITILRAGTNVATVNKEEVNEQKVAHLMLGAEIRPLVKGTSSQKTGKMLLEVKNISVTGDRGLQAVRDLSLQVNAGQILGLAGLAGNGQCELAECIAGLRMCEKGSIFLEGKNITGKSVRSIIKAGVSLIPEDRSTSGLVPDLTLHENAVLRGYWDRKYSRGLLLNWGAVKEYAQGLVKKFAIQTPKIDEIVWKLSGGNQQRLLVAREITSNPLVIIASHPTSGLDVQAMIDIHNLLLEQRNQGVAILLISEDLDELINISDLIAVMYCGQISGFVKTKDADRKVLGLMMMGITNEEKLR
jgi:ABC-type uncharacterized transport system ATPase subunit